MGIDFIKCSRHFDCKIIETKDVFIGLSLFIFFSLIIFNYLTKLKLQKSPLKEFLIRAFLIKIFGSIIACLVYEYYYTAGDMMNFYASSSTFFDVLFENFTDFVHLFYDRPIFEFPRLGKYEACLLFHQEPKSWTVVRFSAIFNIFCFDSFIPTSMCFGMFSFFCSWKFFIAITKLYPSIKKEIFYCLFFIPSVVFWGSSIFKDTLTLSFMLLGLSHFVDCFILNNWRLKHLIWIGISLFIIFKIRSFFFGILFPLMLFWWIYGYRDKIKNPLIKLISIPAFLVFSITALTLTIQLLSTGENAILNEENLKNTAEGFQSWHGSLGGSAYTLGDSDFSSSGIIKKIPAAINVTLFRPYPWEIKTFFQTVVSLQSLFFLFFTIRSIWRARVIGLLRILSAESFVLFCFLFSLFYAFVCGFTSYNFGALDRYKIPVLPFYLMALVLIDKKAKVYK